MSISLALTLVLALGLPGQDYEIPNDRLGVGAAGRIGRGTGPGEHMVPVAQAQLSPVASSFTTPLPTPAPASAPSERRVTNRPAARQPAANAPAPTEITLVLPALVRGNPYMALHRGWVHGHWKVGLRGKGTGRSFTVGLGLGDDPDEGGRLAPGFGYQPGMGLGTGIPAWLIGPMVYDWRYYDYNNPFAGAVPPDAAGQPRPHDYTHPVYVQVPPPTEDLLDEALTKFRSAREGFRRGDYLRSLQLADEALRLLPNDPTLQQFRALALFALHRYDEAAATLYAVLAVVPGWDWRTMIFLFGTPANYTRELRNLETYVGENPRKTAARFVLAYHYLTAGYALQAADQWERVLAGQPNDPLSTQLIAWLRTLQASGERSQARIPTPPAPAKPPGKLEGTWTARPDADSIITLTFQHHGDLVWQVKQRGTERRIEGYCVYVKGILTVTEDQDKAMMGSVQWEDADHFTFRILGASPDDPGLAFVKSPTAPK